jgi:hypothetical protein
LLIIKEISTNEPFGLSGGIESSPDQFFTHSSQVSIFLQIHPGINRERPGRLYPARRTMLKKDDRGGGIPLKNVIDEPLVCNTARVIFLFH